MCPSASCSSSRRRAGSTSSRGSWARTAARASSAASSVSEFLQRQPEQLFQAHDLAQPLDLLERVGAVRAGDPRAGRPAAAPSARSSGSCAASCRPAGRRRRCAAARRPRAAGRPLGGAAWVLTLPLPGSRRRARRRRRPGARPGRRRAEGRSRHTKAPSSETADSAQSATCMFEMKGASFSRREALGETREDREEGAFRNRGGDDREHEGDRQHRSGVLQQRAGAGGDAAAVGGHDAHHGGRVGAVEHPRADAHEREPQGALPVGARHLERRHAGQPVAVTSIPIAASAAGAVPVGVDPGERGGDEHAERERRPA